MEKETIKKTIILSAFALFMILAFFWTYRKEQSLYRNRKTTIGKVTDVKFGQHGSINFSYYVNGILFESSDPDDASWPQYVRDGKAQKHKFYPVEYDGMNPSNSKILITRTPLGKDDLLRSGILVEGTVENAYPVSDDYVDLHINYCYLKGEFRFRTRLHKDSLPCGTTVDCQQSTIEVFMAKDYPELNDLYFKSYDRLARAKAAQKE